MDVLTGPQQQNHQAAKTANYNKDLQLKAHQKLQLDMWDHEHHEGRPCQKP